MQDVRNVLSAAALVIAFVSYVPYVRDILAGKTKPHAFSWLVWCVLNAIAFAGQLHARGGVGALPVGFTALVMLGIFGLALVKGEKGIRLFDWICLSAAAIALVPWLLTSDPLLSIVLITLIDALGFLPTVRKSYRRPQQETLATFGLSIAKYALVVLALQTHTWVTLLFPVSLVIMNALFVVMLALRRRQLAAQLVQ